MDQRCSTVILKPHFISLSALHLLLNNNADSNHKSIFCRFISPSGLDHSYLKLFLNSSGRMINPISWAKKEFFRIRLQKQKRLLLPQSRPQIDANDPPVSPVQEVIISADLRCGECERRVSSILSSIDDVESIVFHVLQKKVTLTPATTFK